MAVSAKRLLEIPDPDRPSVTQATLNALYASFAMGLNDVEACLVAGIHKSTLYRYQNSHPEFLERKSDLKSNPIVKAKTTVYKLLDTDISTAKWYLERKAREEFGQQIDITHKVELSDEQIEARLKVLLSSNPDLIELIQDPESGEYGPDSGD